MTYKETISYLYNRVPAFQHVGRSAYKEGLGNTLVFDRHFGHPHRAYPTIHVAGTNGKGSTAHTLAAILQAAGKRVGLYTSPHLIDFRERIRVNGEPIAEQRVVDFVEEERAFFEPLQPSFFELTTALAFLYFKEQAVDVAVIEVGLGGRLDCTNVVVPELSVITNISYDHTDLLGDTLEKIAAEKAGIMKPGVLTVIGEATEETRPVFSKKAAETGARIVFAEDEPLVTTSAPAPQGGRIYQTALGELTGELGGLCQEKNTNTTLHAISQLRLKGWQISDEAVREGFCHVCERTGLMGRWQVVKRQPTVVCDTGHNVGGFSYIVPQLMRQTCRRMRIVIGMVSDKDVSAVMEMLPKDASYYFTRANIKRALPEDQLSAIAATFNLRGKNYASVPLAYAAALHDANAEDFIFVGGSSYIVADFLSFLRNT